MDYGVTIELHPSVKKHINETRGELRRFKEALDALKENPLVDLDGHIEVSFGSLDGLIQGDNDHALDLR